MSLARDDGLLEYWLLVVLILAVAFVLLVPRHELLELGVVGALGTTVLEALSLDFFGARYRILSR